MDRKKPGIGSGKYDFMVYKCFFAAAIIIGAAFAVIHTVLLWIFYDTESALYAFGSGASTRVFYILTVLIILASFSVIYVTRNQTSLPKTLPPVTNPMIFIASMCGFMILAVVALKIFYPAGFVTDMSTLKLAKVFSVLFKIVSFPAAAFFFMLVSKSKNSYKITTVLGFFPILWCIFNLMCIYFDQTVPINNPLRIFSQVVLISVLAYFLLEERFRIGKPIAKLYFISAYISIFLIIMTAIPEIILTFSGKWSSSTDTISIISHICIGAYISARVLSFGHVGVTKKKLPDAR